MRQFLEDMFRAAIAAADPAVVLPAHLPAPPVRGRTVVIGAGKAAASMARALEDHWQGPLQGLVITRYGHGVPCAHIEVVEAAHPVPDAAGLAAAVRILDMVKGLSADDLVICLISGGGSALLTAPAPSMALADKQAINNALLRSGAPITEMNIVRKHLSAIKGGLLAVAAAPAKVVSLIISDVPGDDPSVVASGPTVADISSFAQARDILAKYRITEPAAAIAVLCEAREETPKPGDTRLAGNEVCVIASASQAIAAAAKLAQQRGYSVVDLGDRIEGEAREVARDHATIVRDILSGKRQETRPCVILSGGETGVTMKGNGRGGRNGEYLLALAIELDGLPGIYALAGDTDGIDGSEGNAGAVITPHILEYLKSNELDAKYMLNNNDSFTLFEQLGCLVTTGPTLTNVNDFRAIVVK